MRIPVTPKLSTKNGVANQNGRLTNALKEKDKAVIRPGLALVSDYAGDGNGLIPFNGMLVQLFGDTIYTGTGTSPGPNSSYTLSAPEYSAPATYDIGDPVWYNGDLWISIVGSNTGNTPGPGLYWARSFPPAWVTTYTYPAGAWVNNGGYIWRSLVDGNIGNTPEEGANWTSPNPPVAGPKASGGTITYDGAYSYHTFTTSGTFTVLIAPLTVDYIVIGGGGSCGADSGDPEYIISAGGAGEYVFVSGSSIATTGALTVTVGAGSAIGVPGGSSTFLTTTAALGGNGGSNDETGYAGACGGGAGIKSTSGTLSGGTASAGFAGGQSVTDDINLYASGGGGGMGAVGADGSLTLPPTSGDDATPGNGGVGVQMDMYITSGANSWVCGGGGGHAWDAVPGSHTYGTPGTGYDHWGGGGNTGSVSYDGQPGVVIIRYLT